MFAKRFLDRHGIPTARMYAICDSAGDAYRALESVDWPVVMKADGLCGGKGVLVTGSRDEARAFVENVMEKRALGDGGKNILLEEALLGQELSLIVLADGKHFVPLVPARDHKRAMDHDQGPNTGGMGAYSTDSIISAELERQILDTVVRPTFDGLAADGLTYQGFLYFGLMLTPEGPKVLEFNCRLGDPETQAIVARMDFDLAEALAATTEGALDRVRFAWRPGASLCVVMASGGYPGSYEVGKRIEGWPRRRRFQTQLCSTRRRSPETANTIHVVVESSASRQRDRRSKPPAGPPIRRSARFNSMANTTGTTSALRLPRPAA